MNINLFTPIQGATVSISATSVNAQGTLTFNSAQARIANTGTNVAFVRWGATAQTATTADMPILPGTVEVFSKDPSHLNFAAICASGETATVRVTPGEGV